MHKSVIIPNALFMAEVEKALQQNHRVKIRVKGNSMRLFLKNERDLVLLEPINPSKLKVNDVVLAQITPKHYILHRIIRIEGNALTLMGDGNIRGTESCLTTDVMAKARAFYRKGRSKADYTDGFKWTIYSSIWLKLKPFRRYILAIVNRLPWDI